MKGKKSDGERVVLRQPPLLSYESNEDYSFLVQAVNEEIKPNGAIEHIFVCDLVYLAWEISRWRCVKYAIMERDLGRGGSIAETVGDDEIVGEVLSGIQAEAIQQNLSDLETIERMLRSLEYRRNDVLRSIAEYRVSLAPLVQSKRDDVPAERDSQDKKVRRLETRTSRRAAA
jgi:hypothetical protein